MFMIMFMFMFMFLFMCCYVKLCVVLLWAHLQGASRVSFRKPWRVTLQGFTFVPPSLLRLSTLSDLNLLPKFGHPSLPRLTLNFSFLFLFFRFSFFSSYFFWRGSFFFSVLFGRQCLFFCFFFFFGRLCPVFFGERVGHRNQTLCQFWRGVQRVGAQNQKKWAPEGWGPKGGSPKGGGLKGGGPKGGWFKISFFLTLSRRKFSLYSSLSGGLLVELWPRFGCGPPTFGLLCGPPKIHVWASLGSFCASSEEEGDAKLFKGLNGLDSLKSLMCSRSA